MNTILLLEDDISLNHGIALKLKKEGFHVLSATSIKEAKVHWFTTPVDMVISDITLPDGSGLDFGQFVRESSDAFLIYLTALNEEINIINGYDTGADDYMTKPFSVNILLSKVHALLRRLSPSSPTTLSCNSLILNLNTLETTLNGAILPLSKTEFLLLRFFLENPGQIISKDTILDQVWGHEGLFVDQSTVTVNISRLKSKLGTNSISNVRGLGYIWTEPVKKQ